MFVFCIHFRLFISTFLWYLQVVHFVSCWFQMIHFLVCCCRLSFEFILISFIEILWVEDWAKHSNHNITNLKQWFQFKKTTSYMSLKVSLPQSGPPSLKVPLPLRPTPSHSAPIAPMQLRMRHSQNAKLSKPLKAFFLTTYYSQGIWNFRVLEKCCLNMWFSKWNSQNLTLTFCYQSNNYAKKTGLIPTAKLYQNWYPKSYLTNYLTNYLTKYIFYFQFTLRLKNNSLVKKKIVWKHRLAWNTRVTWNLPNSLTWSIGRWLV